MRYNSFTHEKFIEELEKRNLCYNGKEFIILEKYKTAHSYITVEDKYGICKIKPFQLLAGHCTYINSAIDKNKYFHNWLLDNNIFYKNGDFKIIGDYINIKKKIVVETKYSYHEVTPENLIRGASVDIRNSTNKNLYLKNYYTEIHNNLYFYDKLDYKKQTEKITVTCEKHGDFKILPLNHVRGQGCYKCGREKVFQYQIENPTGWSYTSWQKAGEKSKNFDSFKVYIIKCWNEDEIFYKIGKTFTTVKRRFKTKKEMPYEYEIFTEIIRDGKSICEIEYILKSCNKINKYIPLKQFCGSQECFVKLDLNCFKNYNI